MKNYFIYNQYQFIDKYKSFIIVENETCIKQDFFGLAIYISKTCNNLILIVFKCYRLKCKVLNNIGFTRE